MGQPGRLDLGLEAINNPAVRSQLLAVAELTTDWIWITDKDHRFIYLSSRMYDHVRARPEDCIGKTRSEAFNIVDSPGIQYLNTRVAAYEEFRDIVYGWLGTDNAEHFVEVSGKPLWETDGSFAGYIGSGRCVTEKSKNAKMLEHAHSELRHRAETDPLTDLHNRSAFNAAIADAMTCPDSRSPTLLLLDLDNFKTINDSLGHQAGDEVLIEFAQRLHKVSRGRDRVFRLGGDEFAILAEAGDASFGGRRMGARLLDEMSTPFQVSDRALTVTCSIGIAGPGASEQPTTTDELIHNADMALYRAKALGRNRFVVYHDHIGSAYREENALLNELERAIETDEITLNYQPIVDVNTCQVIGVEALARWSRACGERVDPLRFIQIAERSGFMPTLGQQVLDKVFAACQQIDKDLFVSVNLSPHQLGEGVFLDHLYRLLDRYDEPAHRFYFEVNESACKEECDGVLRELDAIRNLGARITLGDFGAGQSSLFHLKAVQFAKIKLDRKFLSDMEDHRSRAILQAVTTIADAMNLTVAAEGVETDKQYQVIRAEGIAQAQGYLFSPPLTIEQLLEHLSSQGPADHPTCPVSILSPSSTAAV
ncbi:MAG: EAL domain-containing protein [Pseudomonadota bacterium]